MDTLESRVIAVPHYPSLARALQEDMLAAAIHIRNVLYDNYQAELVSALIALDMSHFIPIENLDGQLFQEYENLKELVYNTPISGYQFNQLAEQFVDIEGELMRRAFFTEGGEA